MLNDALGRSIVLARVPQRIISLVPSLTEYLFAIGLGGRLVGVTEFCTKPAEGVASLPKLRGTKNPDRALIQALQPDLILASKEENRERDVVALEAAGLAVYVTDICRVAGALEELTTLARILAAEGAALPLLTELRTALNEAEAALALCPSRRLLTFIWRDPWMAVGADTYAHDLLRLAGAENLALRLGGRYPRAPLETFMALDPELILLPSEPYAFTTADLEAFAPFTERSRRILLCDGELLTWYGPRSAEALRLFRELLHDCSA